MLNFPERYETYTSELGGATVSVWRAGNSATITIRGDLSTAPKHQQANIIQLDKYFRHDKPNNEAMRFIISCTDLNGTYASALFYFYPGGALNIYRTSDATWTSVDLQFSYTVPDYVP